MTSSIQKILAPLGPHWDRIIRRPMSRKEVDEGLERSQIRVLDALFKAKCPGYKFVDYGPLDLSDDEED